MSFETLFWVSLIVLVYTYAGYPVIIGFLARFLGTSSETCASPDWPVTIVIVAHNEESVLAAKLESCIAQEYSGSLEIVVISDGSSDRTLEVVSEYAGRGVRSIRRATRQGKAACLNEAVRHCTTELIVFTDARQVLDKAAVRMMIHHFADRKVGAVTGELQFVGGQSGFSEGLGLYWAIEKKIREYEARYASVVGVTGAIYAIRKSLFMELPEGIILDDLWVPMHIAREGYRVLFDRRSIAFDHPSGNAAAERRRKVRTLAGNYQLIQLCPWLVLPWANPLWWQFVSHKLLRLLSPLFLFTLALSNILLVRLHWEWVFLAAGQAMFYALAALGLVSDERVSVRLVKIPSVFVALNWFAFLGALEFLRNRKVHLW